MDAHQSLFYSNQGIIAPPRPKRKVVKTVEAWAVFFEGGNVVIADTEDKALRMRWCGHNDRPDPERVVRLTGTYKVFE